MTDITIHLQGGGYADVPREPKQLLARASRVLHAGADFAAVHIEVDGADVGFLDVHPDQALELAAVFVEAGKLARQIQAEAREKPAGEPV